jgi:hypothetical protein
MLRVNPRRYRRSPGANPPANANSDLEIRINVEVEKLEGAPFGVG